MIIVKLNGGLGNQMFQFAFGRALSLKYSQYLYVDKSIFPGSDRNYSLDLFPLESNLLNKSLPKNLRDFKVYQINEDQFGYNSLVMNSLNAQDLDKSLLILSGYWQSFKYFSSIMPILQEDFKLIYPISKNYSNLRIKILETESVMVHVRRGDYLLYGNLKKHGFVGLHYIDEGLRLCRIKLSNPVFFIFSDDINWCMENIQEDDNIVFVEADSDEGRTSFSLMRQCKHFIISNSTFSWWAAWLGAVDNKLVISPKIWFQDNHTQTFDLIPPQWIRF